MSAMSPSNDTRDFRESDSSTEAGGELPREPPLGTDLQFQDVVFDGEPHIAVGFGEAADGFRLVYPGFQHHKRYGDAAAGALDGVDGSGAVDIAGAHQDANAALYQLRILHVHVDHQV